MVEYRNLAKKQGFLEKDIFLLEDGQEVIFGKEHTSLGRKIKLENVFVDEISGEELESYVLRDRQKLAKEGVMIILVEIEASSGEIVDSPTIVARGLSGQETQDINRGILRELNKALLGKKHSVTDWMYMRKLVGEVSERYIFKTLRKRPLVLPVVIEV